MANSVSKAYNNLIIRLVITVLFLIPFNLDYCVILGAIFEILGIAKRSILFDIPVKINTLPINAILPVQLSRNPNPYFDSRNYKLNCLEE